MDVGTHLAAIIVPGLIYKCFSSYQHQQEIICVKFATQRRV
jgi:hypothetical protein